MLGDMTTTELHTRWLAWLCRIGFHDWEWVGADRMCSRCTTPETDHETV